MSAQRQQGGGLSMQTLLIASVASMAAAIVVHEIWKGGAILGAAITPVIVAVVSEALRRPVSRVHALREDRRSATGSHTYGGTPVGPPPPAPPPEPGRADPFGIWQADTQPWYRRLDRRHLRLALVTGVIAFVVGAVALTAAELVFGGSVGGGGDRVTIVPGGRDRDRDSERERRDRDQQRPSQTQPATPAPEEAAPPGQTQPQATQPAPTTTEPAQPEVAPEPAQPAPVPEPQTTAPTAPGG